MVRTASVPDQSARGVALPREAKVFFGGTHRVRPPEQTWAMISSVLPEFGITRVGDVTGLDALGVPVAMAVRPLARSLTVSQGKGQTLLLARISAAMESIEFWHAENAHRPLIHTSTPADELDLPYHVGQLGSGPDSLVTRATRLDWVASVGMISGRTVPVPSRLVTLPPRRDPWAPPGLVWSTNGLAAGNSRQEACLHGLYEIIERDAMTPGPDSPPPEYVDPTSIATDDDECASLVRKIVEAAATLRISRLPSRFAVPCFSATIWSTDFPLTCQGLGAHLDAGVALSRALTEAAQSRLTAIAGSRDDLPKVYRQVRSSTGEPIRPQSPLLPLAKLAETGPGPFADVTEELSWICARIHAVTGVEPLCCELGTAEEFAVVRMFAPGTVFDPRPAHE